MGHLNTDCQHIAIGMNWVVYPRMLVCRLRGNYTGGCMMIRGHWLSSREVHMLNHDKAESTKDDE
jgi:hypothetical protein